jgi:hypothetical protein
MNYSNQKWFCNCCGKEMFSALTNAIGGKYLGYRVCSKECLKEIRWRDTLCIMNVEYKIQDKG